LDVREERGWIQRGNNRFDRLNDSMRSGYHYLGVLDRRRNLEEDREYKCPCPRCYDLGLMLVEEFDKVKSHQRHWLAEEVKVLQSEHKEQRMCCLPQKSGVEQNQGESPDFGSLSLWKKDEGLDCHYPTLDLISLCKHLSVELQMLELKFGWVD